MTRFALVPADPTDEMLNNVYQEVGGSCHVCTPWNASDDDSRRVFADLLEVNPGNALLSEILAARDYVTANSVPAKRCNDLRLILDALAKLGPAL